MINRGIINDALRTHNIFIFLGGELVMKMTKILSLVLALIMVAACFTACPSPDPEPDDNTNALAGTYDIKVWVSELDAEVGEDENGEEIRKSVVDLTKEQIQKFMDANPGIVINAEISGVPEGDAASQVLTDVATAPDIYCFAQDQLARLVQASALAAPADSVASALKSANDTNSVKAASVAGTIYAYPMTSDNGYYLYYDKSVVTDPTSLEQIIADIEAYNVGKDVADQKKFVFGLENAWYTASFFFATGCVSNWTMDIEGNWTGFEDTFNSEAGVAAMKGMMKLAQSSCYQSDENKPDGAAAWVNGIWNANTAQKLLGENFGVCKLPSFTVDGKTYQLGSYSGNKLMGVKPQNDAKRAAVLSLLAQYLTNEQCQLDRYELMQWGPSNLAAQENESVKSNLSLIALAEQNQYAIPQGQIHGSWWDIAKVLGADAKTVKTDDEIKAALNNYTKAANGILGMTDEQKAAMSMIGEIAGGDWNTDRPMNKVEEGVWESDPIDVVADQAFKFRQGANWDMQIPASGVAGKDDGSGNIVVEVTGKYIVRLTWDGNEGSTATWEFVPAE